MKIKKWDDKTVQQNTSLFNLRFYHSFKLYFIYFFVKNFSKAAELWSSYFLQSSMTLESEVFKSLQKTVMPKHHEMIFVKFFWSFDHNLTNFLEIATLEKEMSRHCCSFLFEVWKSKRKKESSFWKFIHFAEVLCSILHLNLNFFKLTFFQS